MAITTSKEMMTTVTTCSLTSDIQGMFRNEKKEKIEMNLTAATLRTVVRTLYTGKTDISTENIQDLLEASNYLQIKDLSAKCVDFMTRNLPSTVLVGGNNVSVLTSFT